MVGSSETESLVSLQKADDSGGGTQKKVENNNSGGTNSAKPAPLEASLDPPSPKSSSSASSSALAATGGGGGGGEGAPGELPINQLSEQELKRVKSRLTLFYKNHFKAGLDKLESNWKKLTAPKAPKNFETAIFSKMMERYKVDPEVEKKEAVEAGCFSSIKVSEKEEQKEHEKKEETAPQSQEPEKDDKKKEPEKPLMTIQEYSSGEKARLRRRVVLFYHNHHQDGLKDVDVKFKRLLTMPLTENDIMSQLVVRYNVPAEVEVSEAKAAGCFERSIEGEFSIKNLPASEKDRFVKRLTLFYKKHQPSNLANVNKALEFNLTEAQVINRLCDKYQVKPLEEEMVAKAHGVWAPPVGPSSANASTPTSLANSRRSSFSPSSPISFFKDRRGSGDEDSNLLSMPTADDLFNKFLQLSDPRKQQRQREREQLRESTFQSPGLSPAVHLSDAVFASGNSSLLFFASSQIQQARDGRDSNERANRGVE